MTMMRLATATNHDAGHFLPRFPSYIPPTITREEYREIKEKERLLFEEILNRLAVDSEEVHPGRVTYIENPCDNSLLGLGVNSLCNIKQIAMDFLLCGYGTCCTDPEPVRPTYLTEAEYRSLNYARENLFRNTATLLCIGPAIGITVPFFATAPHAATVSLAILNNVSSLIITGCMTYFWGDFGARELAAFEYMNIGMLKTAEYLENKWMRLDDSERAEFLPKVERMARNCAHMIEGMTNRGITPPHAELIVTPLAEVLRKIRFNEYPRAARPVLGDL